MGIWLVTSWHILGEPYPLSSFEFSGILHVTRNALKVELLAGDLRVVTCSIPRILPNKTTNISPLTDSMERKDFFAPKNAHCNPCFDQVPKIWNKTVNGMILIIPPAKLLDFFHQGHISFLHPQFQCGQVQL